MFDTFKAAPNPITSTLRTVIVREFIEVYTRAKWPAQAELVPVSMASSDWEYHYSPLDGLQVHLKVDKSYSVIKVTGLVYKSPALTTNN